jgi:serine/threonine protein kinase
MANITAMIVDCTEATTGRVPNFGSDFFSSLPTNTIKLLIPNAELTWIDWEMLAAAANDTLQVLDVSGNPALTNPFPAPAAKLSFPSLETLNYRGTNLATLEPTSVQMLCGGSDDANGASGFTLQSLDLSASVAGTLLVPRNASEGLTVTGACDVTLNGYYTFQDTTLDGRGFYKNGAGKYLHYDADCDGGSGTSGRPWWIFDDSKPSTTKANDLDGDGQCALYGYIASTSTTVPAGTNSWNIYCDGAWTTSAIQITFDSDLNRDPAAPPATIDVNLDLTGFSNLAAFAWHNKASCPPGFYTTTNSPANPRTVLCGKCPIGTEKLTPGGTLDDCIACETIDPDERRFDYDGDAATACEPSNFVVDDWEWNTTAIATINTTEYMYQTKADAQSPPKIYGVKSTYQFPQIKIPRSSIHHAAAGNVTFTMDGAPDGFLIDPKTGYIKGTPTVSGNGIQEMKIYAVDGAGTRTATPLVTVQLDVRGGPNGEHCLNGGKIVDDGGNSFSCNCSETTTFDALKGFDGSNCKADIAKRETEKLAKDKTEEADENLKDARASAANATASLQVAEAATKKSEESLVAANEANRKSKESLAAAEASEAEAKASLQLVTEANAETFTTGLAAGGVILFLLLVVAAVKYRQHVISMKPIDFEAQFALMVSMGLIEPDQVKVQMKPREIRRKDLTLVKVIGSGAFGEVYKAQLDESHTRSAHEYTVAAKTVLDAKSSPEATKEMLAEAGVMAAVGTHPNLVSLIGVITRGDPLVLILQFCAQGELLGMLKKAAAEGEPIALMDKMQMAREVAKGMTHLSKEHFIHRDLACRNVLYSEGMCKIADFGLSRGGGGESTTAENEDVATHEDYYKSTAGVFPVRWTAPEAMETLRFTTASDVWSFGIVVVELLVDGETPYHGMSNPDVMKMTMSGGRHPKPPLCSNKLYDMLLKCWDVDTAKRPGFSQLCDAFKEMYTVSSKSADANAARVEAAAIDRLKRGEAANQYTSFDAAGDDGGGGGAVGEEKTQLVNKILKGASISHSARFHTTTPGQEAAINQIDETSFTNTKASDQPPAHFYPQTN